GGGAFPPFFVSASPSPSRPIGNLSANRLGVLPRRPRQVPRTGQPSRHGLRPPARRRRRGSSRARFLRGWRNRHLRLHWSWKRERMFHSRVPAGYMVLNVSRGVAPFFDAAQGKNRVSPSNTLGV